MPSRFDNQVKMQAQEFRLEPREGVWPRVAAELEAKKRKRPLYWWWIMLPVGIAGLYFTLISLPKTNQNINNQTIASKKNSTNSITKGFSPQRITEKLKNNVHLNRITKRSADTKKQPILLSLPTKQLREAKDKTIGNANASNFITSKYPSITTIVSSNHSFTASDEMAAIASFEANTKTLQSNLVGFFQPQLNDSFPKPLSNLPVDLEQLSHLKTPLIIDSLLDSIHQAKKLTAKKQLALKSIPDVEWNLQMSVGLYNNQKGWDFNGFGGNKSLLANQFQSTSTPPTAPTIATLEASKPGIGWSFGLVRAVKINKHPRWQLLTGIHYKYLSLTTFTGNRKDSALVIGSIFNNNMSSDRATYFYQAGNNQSQKGHQHSLQLMGGLAWQVNKRGYWQIQGQVYAGAVIGQNYLVPSTSINSWLSATNFASQYFWGVQTGISTAIFPKWKCSLLAMYNLSATTANKLLPKQHWQGIAFQTTYQLKQKQAQKKEQL